jgi:hypothetical protein
MEALAELNYVCWSLLSFKVCAFLDKGLGAKIIIATVSGADWRSRRQALERAHARATPVDPSNVPIRSGA